MAQTLHPLTRGLRSASSSLAIGTAVLMVGGVAAAQDRVAECQDLYTLVTETGDFDNDTRAEVLAVVRANEASACYYRLEELEVNQRPAATERAMGQERDMEERTRTASRDAARTTQRDAQQTQRQRLQATAQNEDDDDEMEMRENERTAQRRETETRTVEREVTLEETVTVAGEVDVAVGVPQVEVNQQAARVTVSGNAPRVSVDSDEPSIVVRERPARISVRMPQPEIVIEQQPPEIIVTLPEPNVDVASAEPQVQVRQARPQVSVRMAEPRIDMDLRAVAGEEAEQVRTRVSRQESTSEATREGLRRIARSDDGGQADVYVGEAEPNVRISGLNEEPEITINQPEPRIQYNRAEPEIDFQMAEPNVRIQQAGEPQVTIRRSAMAEDEEPAQQRQALRSQQNEQRQARAEAREEATTTRTATSRMQVDRVVGTRVLSAGGDEIGEIGRFVRANDNVYAVLNHGGFFGLGEKEIVVPLDELRWRGDEIVAANLTEELVNELDDQDITSAADLNGNERVRIRTR
jgi:hypothetical protein